MTKWLIAALALASVPACTIDATGPKQSVDATVKDETAFCTTWAKAACNSEVVSNCDEVDTATCVEHQSSFCQGLVPSAGYSSKRAQDCIDAVRAAYADAVLDADELDVVLNLGGDCAHLVAGPDKVGEACSEPNDCDTVDNYTCVIKAGDTTGTCQIPEIQDNGEPCDGPAMVCNPEAYCDGSNCLVDKPVGKACTYDAMCESDAVCDIASDSTDGSGTCAAKLNLQASCTDDSQCASGICLQATLKCTSKIVLTDESSLCQNL
jgi:hypothetical protein